MKKKFEQRHIFQDFLFSLNNKYQEQKLHILQTIDIALKQ